MKEFEFDIDKYSNMFIEEPEFHCPVCDNLLHTDWVDNGFGPYSVQASPYGCDSCGWFQKSCYQCLPDKCYSWEKCKGRGLI